MRLPRRGCSPCLLTDCSHGFPPFRTWPCSGCGRDAAMSTRLPHIEGKAAACLIQDRRVARKTASFLSAVPNSTTAYDRVLWLPVDEQCPRCMTRYSVGLYWLKRASTQAQSSELIYRKAGSPFLPSTHRHTVRGVGSPLKYLKRCVKYFGPL